jgi:pantoate--beta-alanine ligase
VIKAMVTDLSMNLKVFGVTTTREDDGLAMSSRNHYLRDAERKLAPTLYIKMHELVDEIYGGRRDFSRLTQEYKLQLAKLGFNPDYLEIRNVENLLQPGHEDKHLVLLAAAFLGKTRLIDNVQIKL